MLNRSPGIPRFFQQSPCVSDLACPKRRPGGNHDDNANQHHVRAECTPGTPKHGDEISNDERNNEGVRDMHRRLEVIPQTVQEWLCDNIVECLAVVVSSG